MAVGRVYVGDDERVYPDLVPAAVSPGDKREFESADAVPDDGRWATAAEAKKKPTDSDEES